MPIIIIFQTGGDIIKQFDTTHMFSGGAAIFIQYHDIVKPVYLSVILKMRLSKNSLGLPIDILKGFSTTSIFEWYIRRRYKNPLKCLDFDHRFSDEELDKMLRDLLEEDKTLYSLTPSCNIMKMIETTRTMKMNCPIYIYNDYPDKNIENDCKKLFKSTNFQVISDLSIDFPTNATFILSEDTLAIDIMSKQSEKFSHILLPVEYRYSSNIDLIPHINKTKLTKLGYSRVYTVNTFLKSLNEIGGLNNATN